jgi:hypothetical protein
VPPRGRTKRTFWMMPVAAVWAVLPGPAQGSSGLRIPHQGRSALTSPSPALGTPGGVDRCAVAAPGVLVAVSVRRLGLIDLRRIKPLGMTGHALPHGEQTVDIAMEEEDKRIAERGMRISLHPADVAMRPVVQAVWPLHRQVEGDEIRSIEERLVFGRGDERVTGAYLARDTLRRISGIFRVVAELARSTIEARGFPRLADLDFAAVLSDRIAHEIGGEQVQNTPPGRQEL